VTLDGSIIRIQPDTGQPVRQTTSMIVATPTIDANGVKSYPVTSRFQGSQPLIVRVLEPTNPVPGRPRRFLYVLPVETGVTSLSSTFGDGLEELRLLDVPNRFNLTLIAPAFNYEPWYGDHATDQTRWMESFVIRDLVPFGDSFAAAGEIPQRFVLGFSKSGNGALILIFRHPNVFAAAAAWDAPAQLTDISAFAGLALNFGTEANFALYEIPTLVQTSTAAFTQTNRLWISGDDSAWTADMVQLHNQLTSASIPHTWVQGGARQHSWGSGWLEGAVTALDANATLTAPVSVNEQRIIAYGLRSPRLTFHPGTQEIWVADRGWNSSEEINRIPSATDGIVENFGWPCYEGSATTGYSGSSICNLLYSQTAATTAPYYTYDHQQKVVAGDEGGVGSGAISGLAFYDSGSYPADYQGALFFSDYLRNHIWVMFKGGDGLPDPANRATFLLGAASPVDLKTGPGGDLFYADLNGGTIRRIRYFKPVVRSNGQPAGLLPAGVTQTTISLATDQNATCRYATAAGVAYGSMPNTFAVTGGTAHSTLVTGLVDGGNYDFSVRCEDARGNTNSDDFSIAFSVARAGDTMPPVRTNGQPTGVLTAGTSQTSLSLTTDESATCRYATTAGVAYGSMPNTFSSTGGTAHSTIVSGLVNGGSYSYYVRCQDGTGNANPDDFVVTFSVGSGSGGTGNPVTSTFSGTEDPLSENGMWDTPGAWTSLKKNNGVYSTDLLSAARLVTPVVGADQYAEITYDQNPGSASWVGVMTRVQGPGNGSGYLAIAYAGEVRLYRSDDSGTLNFPLLVSASADVGAAPRRLRMESQGANHRVYFNGVLALSYTASGIMYTTGQPGIAGSVFGGPTVKILSFAGGALAGAGDTVPPVRTNGQPTGVLTAGTSQTSLSLTTDESATCRYATTAGVAYGSMPNTFSSTGGTAHSTTVSGLVSGGNYNFLVRCQDASGNANPDDFPISFSIAQAPAITSANSTTFTVGTAGSFTVTTTGTPTPSVTETGALPSGVAFVDNGNGTARLSGTPAAGAAASYAITIKAHNGVGTDANQSFTLKVNQAPAITSANSTTFTVGTAGSFTVTTTGTPTPSVTETGALPSGVTFVNNGNGTARLSGTPAAGAAASYAITIKAHNGVGTDASQGFTLTVNGGGGGGGSSTFAYVSGSVTGVVLNAGGGSGTTLSIPLHQNPGAGHLLICAATWQSSTATASMTDPNNGTWTAIGSAKTGTGSLLRGYRGQMFYVPAAVNAATTVTLRTSSAVGFRAFECAEYSYTGTIPSLDGTPQYSTTRASSGVATIGGLTTSNSSDLVFADCLGVDTTCTTGSGYTGLDDTNTYVVDKGVSGQSFWNWTGQLIEYKVGVAAGAQSATFRTGTTTDNVILGLVAF
jgi:hypothetical protein